MAFQQARAVVACLDVLENSAVAGIRVEGRSDAVDIEFLDSHDRVLRGIQAKTRAEPDTWGRREILQAVQGWLAVEAVEGATFEFATDGSLGPSGVAFRVAIIDANTGNPNDLTSITGIGVSDPRFQRLLRVELNSRLLTTGATLREADARLAALGPASLSYRDALAAGAAGVNKLYRALFEWGGDSAPIKRRLLRDEIATLCGLSPALLMDVGKRWLPDIRATYIGSIANAGGFTKVKALFNRIDPVPPALGTLARLQGLARRPEEEGDELDAFSILRECASSPEPLFIAAQTGAGKTVAALELRIAAAQAGIACIVLSAEGYFPGNFAASLTDAVGRSLNGAVPIRTAQEMLIDDSTIVVFDGGSELSDDSFRSLREEMHRLYSSNMFNARLVIIGREIARLRIILPTNVSPRAYTLRHFGEERRRQLVAAVVGDMGRPENEAVDLLERAERALGKDDAGSPLMLDMCTTLLLRGYSFTGRAELYGEFVTAMADRAQILDFGIKKTLLGAAFAELLNRGVRYSDTYSWLAVLERVVKGSVAVTAGGLSPRSINDAAKSSGLILQEGFGDIIVPSHDSLADYLAAVAHARGAIDLPDTLRSVDSQRVMFLAEIAGVGQPLATRVARGLPMVAIQIADFDSATDDTPDIEHVRELYEALSGPLAERRTGVQMWRDRTGRLVVSLVDDGIWAIVPPAEGRRVPRVGGAVFVAGGGALHIAVRIWNLVLQRELRRERGLPAARPTSAAEARDAVEAHVRAVAEQINQLVQSLFRSDIRETLKAQIGPLGMTAEISPEVRVQPFEHRLMWYLKSVDTSISVASAPNPMQTIFGSTSAVESYLDSSPRSAAASEVVRAINQLTGRWLRI